MELGRRRLLFALGALLAPATGRAAALGGLDEHEIEVPGEPLASRCLVLSPRGRSAATRRLLVLFHGLGETRSQALGVRAFADRYGLAGAYERLRQPPLARILGDAVYLTDARIAELNAELGREPFGGLTLVCPYTPNVFRQPSTPAALDRYAAWTVDQLLPVVKKTFEVPDHAGRVAVDGVSLGGYVSLEVFLRRPEAFAAVGTTQGAFGVPLAEAYAARFEAALRRAGKKAIRVSTSSGDGGRKASERLVRKLRERGIEATLTVSPGPHDQRWLREVGSLELLHFYDRALPRGTAASKGGS